MVKLDRNNHIRAKIMKSKCSIRYFKEEKPPKILIKKIIEEGMATPYDSPEFRSVKNFRKFFIFEKGTTKSKKLVSILENNANNRLHNYERQLVNKPFIKSKIQTLMNMLQIGVNRCVSIITTAPYLVIVSELRDVLPAEQEPFMDILENMHLKANVLNLDLQHIILPCGNLPIISQMSGDEELMKLLGLPLRKLALNGCVIGYPIITSPDINNKQIILE